VTRQPRFAEHLGPVGEGKVCGDEERGHYCERFRSQGAGRFVHLVYLQRPQNRPTCAYRGLARDLPVMPKRDFLLSQVRRSLEPGPVVLVSSAHKGMTNIMTMGWHMAMETEPSLIGCYIWVANHSRELIVRARNV
jgi:hypothetical protein